MQLQSGFNTLLGMHGCSLAGVLSTMCTPSNMWSLSPCKSAPKWHLNQLWKPDIYSVSALPGETQTTENASLQLNSVCCFARKHAKHIITTSHSN